MKFFFSVENIDQCEIHPGADLEITGHRPGPSGLGPPSPGIKTPELVNIVAACHELYFFFKTKLDRYLGWQYIFPISDLA